METRAKIKILIMDDDSLMREMLRQLMDSLGYDATIVAGTREAISTFKTNLESNIRFDLVILDLMMPGNMSGLDVFRCLRALDPATRAMLISGCTYNGVMEKFQQYGFVAKLDKPFALDDFAVAIKTALQSS